jgi:hypothetical protein
MVEEDMLVIATNSPTESLVASKYQGMTIKEEIKVDGITSRYYLVIKADWEKVDLLLIKILVDAEKVNKK